MVMKMGRGYSVISRSIRRDNFALATTYREDPEIYLAPECGVMPFSKPQPGLKT